MLFDNIKSILKKPNSLFLNSFSNVINFFWGVLSVLILTPWVYTKLGKEEYGLWLFIMSLLSYSSLLYFGFGSAIIKYLAEYVAKKEYENANELVSSLMSIYFWLGVLTFLFALVVSTFLPSFIQLNPDLVPTARIAVLIVGVELGICFPMSVYGGILSGMQKYVTINSINILCSILFFTLVLVILPFNTSLITLALISLGGRCINFLLDYIVVRKSFDFIKIKLDIFKLNDVRPLFKFSLKSFLIQISSRMIDQTDTIVIGAVLGPASITQYSIPQRMVQYSQDFLQAVSGVLFPHFTQLHSKGLFNELKDSWLKTYSLSFTLNIIITMMLLIYGVEIQKLWMGQSFQVNYWIIIVLGINYLFQQPVTRSILIATNNHGLPAVLLILEACLNLIFSLIFVHKWGIVGVAIGTLLPAFCISSIVVPILVIKRFKLQISEFLWIAITRPLLIGVVPTTFLIICYKMKLGYEWVSFIEVGLLYSIISLVSMLIANREWRNFLMTKFHVAFKKNKYGST
jgi:O-antigen/teichoic acid export membrane protein